MVVIEQGSVEASLMMMNQVDSSNFDNDKDLTSFHNSSRDNVGLR